MTDSQLVLAQRLQRKLSSIYPTCMVVPFGGPISGHGTLSSDCDLCLLTCPHSTDKFVFSGHAYFSERLLTVWQDQLQSVETSGDNGDEQMATDHSTEQLQSLSDYDRVLSVVMGDNNCVKVVTIRHAKCPIIRFFYIPFQQHCDLSINNRYVYMYMYNYI